ncbi:hypothetical protein BK005_00700 [bacterium CG10_37_50]|nr:MAG: hypothetical protein BK005_00700 [bacterium CG10_37_50]
MEQRKTKLYIIPGLGESTRAKNYREIIKLARKTGFEVNPVNILWEKNMDMTDFVVQADKKIPNDSSDDYILGFSFGAYIVSILSKKKKIKGIIFCSISPYFKEDLKDIPLESKEYFGKKMMDSFKRYTFPKKIKSTAWFLIGEKDWPLTISRAQKSFKLWGGIKSMEVIKGAGHSLDDKKYFNAIKKIIKKL